MERRPQLSPLLEFDDAVPAFIEPGVYVQAREVPLACVVTFFGDSVRRLVEMAGPPSSPRILGRTAPIRCWRCSTRATGCRGFIVCGGAGALLPEVTLGHVVVVESALRDEGTSYHYLPASRWVDADRAAASILKQTLDEHGVPFIAGRTLTTDAPYRETPGKIAARRQEGRVTVEMEAAALAAVASFRGVPLAHVLYGGDDLSGQSWDHRSWQTQADVRKVYQVRQALAVIAKQEGGSWLSRTLR